MAKQLMTTLAVFVVASFTAWLCSVPLLSLVAEPVSRSWQAARCNTFSFEDGPSYFRACAQLALTAGALVALPFAAALLAQWWGWRPAIEHGFVAVSYLVEAVAVVAAHILSVARVLHPISRTGWCGKDWVYGFESFVNELVTLTCQWALGLALLLELGLVALWFRHPAWGPRLRRRP